MTKKIFVVLLLISFLIGNPVITYASKSYELREIQEKSEYYRKKIDETRQKEKLAVTKLTAIQKELLKTQENLRRNVFKLSTTQHNLKLTEDQLRELKSDYFQLQVNAEKRIRQIYQGQRLKMLEILLRSPSLTDFLDNLYYQKLVVKRDRTLLGELEEESNEIEDYKDRLAKQKIEIANIVNKIDNQKGKIAREHLSQSLLVNKLRSERAEYEKAERQLERDSQNLIGEINRLTGKFLYSGPPPSSTGIFSYPIRGRLTSGFGPRRHPIHRVISFHSGIDLAAPYGSAIMASDSGRVIFNGWYGGYGKVVIVDHGKNYSTLYAHLSRTNTSRGESIQKGQVVGYEGQTGYSTGPHLHFEVRKDGKPQNPLNYLR